MTIDLESLRGLDAHRSAHAELVTRLAELESLANGRPFTEQQMAEWEENVAQRDELALAIRQLEVRDKTLKDALGQGGEAAIERMGQSPFPVPNLIKVPDDIYDLSAYRQRVSSVDQLAGAYADGAKRAIEKVALPTSADPAKAKERLMALLERHGEEDYGWVSRRILGTDSPVYREAWARYVAGGQQAVMGNQRLQAALLTYTDADGGYAIPFSIDPTFVLTSVGAVNPLRQIARVETITTKAWQAVTTGGVTAAYAAETAAAADAAPTDFDNPTGTPLRAHVLVGFSAEYSEDYGPAAIQAEIGRLIRDAKDTLEATKFVLGNGTTEPDGIVAHLITAAGSSIIQSDTANTFSLADIELLEGALGERWLPNAQWLAARAIYQLARGFGTAGAPANSIYDPNSKELLGYPGNISTAMDKVTTTGAEPLLFGDFQNFVIVDRLGLSTEFIPQLVDSSGDILGRRGVYARWRNDTVVLTDAAFALLHIK